MVIIPVDTLLKEVRFAEGIMQYTNNEFILALYEGEDELNISESSRMTLKVTKPDGTIACNYVHILDGNEAYVKWDEAKEVPAGEYVMNFTIHYGLSSMNLPPIYITITENPNGKPKAFDIRADYAVRAEFVSEWVYELEFTNYNSYLHDLVSVDFYVDGLLVSPLDYSVGPSSKLNCILLSSKKEIVADKGADLKILYTVK